MRSMYIQSRTNRLNRASNIHQVLFQLQVTFTSTLRSAVFQISSAVMASPMNTGKSILPRLKPFSTLRSSPAMR